MIKKVINHQEEFVAQSSSGGGSLDQQQADWNQSNSSAVDYIKNKPTIPDAQIQSDWNQSDNSEKDYIKNKPTLGTAASLDVATSGNASTTQVVKGDDTRLTDARTPVSHTHTKSEITDFPTLGTAAAKDSTNAVTENSTALVESGAVKTAIDAAVASAYHHAGTKTVSELVAALLVAANEGNVYNITDSGTTTADFIEGAGKIIRAGDNVGIAKVDTNTYKFDLLSGFVDISGKADKVTSATAGNFAGLDSSGNLTDSGKKAADFAERADLTSIITTGATNATGSTITAGTYFYLNGSLVKAKADIANGASYTLNTNYEAVTIGNQLTALNSNNPGYPDYSNVVTTITTQNANYTATQDGWLVGTVGATEAKVAYVQINGIQVGSFYTVLGTACPINYTICVPIKTGDVITTRSDSGGYSLTVYKKR